MNLLSINGKLYKFLTTLLQITILNFLWIVFSIPIFTIGSATVAVFSVSLKMVDDQEANVAKQFISAFKQNFKQGIPLGLIALFVGYAGYLCIEILIKVPDATIFLLFAAIIIIAVGLFHLLYAFAIIARYESTVKDALINSKNISTKYFLRTLLLWLLIAILVLLFQFNYTLIFFGILIGPVSIMYLISSFAMYFFKKIDEDNQS